MSTRESDPAAAGDVSENRRPVSPVAGRDREPVPRHMPRLDALDAGNVLIPLLVVNGRTFPRWCPRARGAGEFELLEGMVWPGVEACRRCRFFVSSDDDGVRCAAPGADRGGADLSVELDLYRVGGRKYRKYLEPGPNLELEIRKQLRFPRAARVEVIDLKFVPGRPCVLAAEPDAYLERWRYYWNGEHWVRKREGDSLHDWNKWGRNLEYTAASRQGGLPPMGGWPPVVDIPPGVYAARIVRLRRRRSRRNEPELEWVFRILDGPHRGRHIFVRAPLRESHHLARLQKDLALVSGRLLSRIPRPGDSDFDGFRERLCGRAVEIEVYERGPFTNVRIRRRLGAGMEEKGGTRSRGRRP